MRKILKRLKGEESGQALILALLMLALGGFIMAPLLTFMGSGLLAGETIEEKMNGIYAADAGIEFGIDKILKSAILLPTEVDGSYTYFDITDPELINKKEVDVTVVLEADRLEFVAELLDITYATTSHTDWQLVEHDPEPGVYYLDLEYVGSSSKVRIEDMGAWFYGSQWEYVEDSVSGITDSFPDFTFDSFPYLGGVAFIWRWENNPTRPAFGSVPDHYTDFLRFEFTPMDIPSLYVGWSEGGPSAIGIATTGIVFEFWQIRATATDPITGGETEIVVYLNRMGEGEDEEIDIWSWEIDPGS